MGIIELCQSQIETKNCVFPPQEKLFDYGLIIQYIFFYVLNI